MKGFVSFISNREDVSTVVLNQDKLELKLITRTGTEVYIIKKKEKLPEDDLQYGLSHEYDVTHDVKQLRKAGKDGFIFKDTDECTCGVKPYHVHCGICGRLIKIGKI